MAGAQPTSATRDTALEVRADELRRALDRIVADAIPLVTGILSGLFAVFSLCDPFINPQPASFSIAAWDAAVALFFLAFFVVSYRYPIAPRHAHAALFVCALVPTVDVLHSLVLLRDPSQTLYLTIIAVGAGSLLLRPGWLVPVLVTGLASWAVIASRVGDASWTTFGFALFAASVLSGLIHAVRVRTYRRLEVLRLVAERAGSERALREQALEAAVTSAWESEERYRKLVENAPDGFLVHVDDKVVYANAAAVRLLGAKAQEDLLGRDSLSFVHPDYLDAVRARTMLIQRDRVPTERMEMKIVRLDGAPVDVEVMGQPISYLGKTADQTIIRDITDRKRVDEERRLARERLSEISRLQELDKMKTQFVNTLSHELRTPLTPIKVQLHLLKSAQASGDKEKQTRSAAMLERNVSRMGSLIDELLEVARLQAGTLKLDKGDVELDATLSEALDSFRDVAKQSGVVVETRLEPHVHVEADARRLTQVMYNLLNNALKFTPEGGHITVDAHEEKGRAVVRVTDTGIGIKKEDIERLFEPFSQVHDTMQKTNAGTGLGLYICKGIIEGHGGEIWCDSPGPGKGTTFAFALPAKEEERLS